MSKVWEYTNGCAKQYICDLAIYLMAVLSSSYGIIINFAINAPGHGNNVFDGINATYNRYLKEKMELIGKFRSNDTSNIGMLPGDLKDIYNKFSDQCIHMVNNKERLNRLKGRKNIEKREPLFKYQSRIYNVQRSSDVNHRGMKMRQNNKTFPSLNAINENHLHMEERVL